MTKQINPSDLGVRASITLGGDTTLSICEDDPNVSEQLYLIQWDGSKRITAIHLGKATQNRIKTLTIHMNKLSILCSTD